MVTCPVCDASIDVEEQDLGQDDSLSCDECGAELKVVGINPLELEPVEEEEDEEDEEDLELDEDEEEDEDERWV